MGFVRPSLVVDTTNTSGTGSYALVNGDPGDGFRNLADAVTDGDAANSDTISYFVVDTTTKGATLQWEHATGTISDSGATVARTSIIESSNGGAAVNWGVGGTRTIRFGAGTAGFAQLAAANTFAETVTVAKAAAAAGFEALIGANTAAANTANSASIVERLLDSAGTSVNALAITSNLSTTTAGSDTARVRFFVRNAGSGTVAFQVQSGALQDGSGNPYALLNQVQGVLNAPSGGRLLWGVVAIPAGWAIITGLSDRMVMMTSTASEADDLGGSYTTGITASTTVDGTTLTESQIPAHTHHMDAQVANFAVDAGGSSAVRVVNSVSGSQLEDTDNTGGDGSHSHTASTTINSTSYRPAYQKWAPIEKS